MLFKSVSLKVYLKKVLISIKNARKFLKNMCYIINNKGDSIFYDWFFNSFVVTFIGNKLTCDL